MKRERPPNPRMAQPSFRADSRPQGTVLLDNPTFASERRVDRLVEAISREAPRIRVILTEVESDAVCSQQRPTGDGQSGYPTGMEVDSHPAILKVLRRDAQVSGWVLR